MVFSGRIHQDAGLSGTMKNKKKKKQKGKETMSRHDHNPVRTSDGGTNTAGRKYVNSVMGRE